MMPRHSREVLSRKDVRGNEAGWFSVGTSVVLSSAPLRGSDEEAEGFGDINSWDM